MSAAPPFSLVVPLWNEGANVLQLVEAIAASGLPAEGMRELVLVNNGSQDDTGALVDVCASRYPWVLPVHLPENHNYGGGVYEGCRRASCEVVCYIPGDLQVLPDDVQKVHRAFGAAGRPAGLLVKGYRTVRHDPMQTRFVSRVYTFLANTLLGLRVRDVNGLPKMFHRSLLDLVPAERMKTFVFDSQLLAVARGQGWRIDEVPVTFHGRRQGVSSWSGKRLRVYLQVARQIWRLRSLRAAPGVPLERLR
jgi:glycosyltransferase involved in cell wall biosynthesis